MRTLIDLSLRRPGAVIAGWLLVLLASAPFAHRLSEVLRGSTDAVSGSPSELAWRDLNDAFGEGSAFVFPVVLTSGTAEVDDPRFGAAARALEQALASAGMIDTRHYWNSADTTLLGSSRRSALVLVTPPAETFFDAEAVVEEIRSALDDARLGSDFTVSVTGTIAMYHDLDANASDDLLRAEKIGVPLTLLVLFLVFGAPVAAGLPLLMALGTTVVTLGFLYQLSGVLPVSVFAQNTVTMVGLGIGVDYALFLVSRHRDELRSGATVRTAIEAAARNAGHVVLVSGIAVCTGFLALFLVRVRFLHTLALGGVAVVCVSVLMTLTLLPALLLLAGEKVNWPERLSRRAGLRSPVWGRWASEAMARPIRYLVPFVILLAVMISPTRRLDAWNVGPTDLSPEMEAREGYEVLRRDFSPGWMGPIALLVEAGDGTLWTEAREEAVLGIHERMATDARVAHTAGFAQLLQALGPARAAVSRRSDLPQPVRAEASRVVSADGRAALLFAVPRFSPESEEVMALVRELRSSSWDAAGEVGLSVQVAGMTAGMIDFDDEFFGSLKKVVPLVLTLTFVFLMVAFRSIVVPLKAIVMNLISVLAAYGFLVYLFQDGIGAGLIGLDPPGGLNSFIVLMLFTILFGLSMDYEVFLLSSIRDEYRRSGDNRQSVINGLSKTGGLITSAALIMVVLFGSFGFTRLTATREFGLGLAFAVALDATLIRVVLVPILMGMMGRANWWFPSFGRRREAA